MTSRLPVVAYVSASNCRRITQVSHSLESITWDHHLRSSPPTILHPWRDCERCERLTRSRLHVRESQYRFSWPHQLGDAWLAGKADRECRKSWLGIVSPMSIRQTHAHGIYKGRSSTWWRDTCVPTWTSWPVTSIYSRNKLQVKGRPQSFKQIILKVLVPIGRFQL